MDLCKYEGTHPLEGSTNSQISNSSNRSPEITPYSHRIYQSTTEAIESNGSGSKSEIGSLFARRVSKAVTRSVTNNYQEDELNSSTSPGKFHAVRNWIVNSFSPGRTDSDSNKHRILSSAGRAQDQRTLSPVTNTSTLSTLKRKMYELLSHENSHHPSSPRDDGHAVLISDAMRQTPTRDDQTFQTLSGKILDEYATELVPMRRPKKPQLLEGSRSSQEREIRPSVTKNDLKLANDEENLCNEDEDADNSSNSRNGDIENSSINIEPRTKLAK